MAVSSDSDDFSDDGDCALDASIENDTSDDEHYEGASSIQMSFNIAKGIVGEGMLSLPAGIAAGTGLVVGFIFIIVFYLLLAYTFWGLGRICHYTDEKTHKGAGDKVTEGRVFGYAMAVTNMVKTVATCTAYAMVIGENSHHMLAALGVEGWYASKQVTLLVVLAVIVFPLSLLRDMSKLAITSLIGLGCEMLVVVFMVIRYFDGSYLEGGIYHDTIEETLRPSWGDLGHASLWQVSPGTMVLFGSLATAFLAHYNAPKMYHQLRNRTSKRFLNTTLIGFTCALGVYIVCMLVGYLTFGHNCQGNILNNYSNKDNLAGFARFGMLIAVTFGYPIAFTGLRDATIQVFRLTTRRRIWVTISLVLYVPIIILACSVDSLGVVNSLGGAIMGSLITLVYPGILLYFAYRSKYKGDVTPFEGNYLAPFLIVFGSVMCVFGATMVTCVKILKIL